MRVIHRSRTLAEAHLVATSLCAAGIDAEIRGALRPSIAGEIPMPDAMVQVCVREQDAEEAVRVLAEIDRDRPEWTCTCGEANPGSFELCWKCGLSAPPPS